MNRIDKMVVFRTLRPEHLQEILDIELGMVQQRVLQTSGNSQFSFSCTAAVKAIAAERGHGYGVGSAPFEAGDRAQYRTATRRSCGHRSGAARRVHSHRPEQHGRDYVYEASRRRSGARFAE